MKLFVDFKVISVVILCILGLCVDTAPAWQSDNGDGTFTNPVLYADYPDPDIIRVGGYFYMVSTTFVDSPGLVVLRSEDMVNWQIISHPASILNGGNAYDMVNGQTAYRGGMWASSIRYRNGTFYIAVQPNFSNGRIYYAANAAGPWNYYQLDRVIYDPGLFFDTDGTGYIICGHGPQSVMTLNSSCSAVVSQVDNVIDSGGEGSHVVKRGSYYYLFNANPGVWPFQLRCSRATNLFGPWETGHICLLATTGGHQGAIVDIDDNDNWFGFVHQDSGAVGRMPRIGPVFWENDWPVFGTPSNRNVIASTYPKPILGKPIVQPPASDDFSSSTLGLQWQWNHNPDNTRWSLTERPGWLRLRPTQASGFWTARNTLTQKGQGPQSHGIVKFDLSNLQNGDIAGFGTLGEVNGYIYVTSDASGNKTLGMVMDDRSVGTFSRASDVPFTGTTLYLRTDLNFSTNQGNCSYSADGTSWRSLGGYFPLEFNIVTGTFQGEKYAIFCYNPNTASSTGYVDVDSFTLGDTAMPVDPQRGRPMLNAARTTFVADNGQLLRGPYTSSEWGNPAPADQIANMKNLGFNAVHLYGECYDINYPNPGSTAPGYAASRIDSVVAATRSAGLYLIITIGNGANNGNYNYDYVVDFWKFYAPRYANETHVIYEIQNEPVAWGPPYSSSSATPPGAINMEAAAYNVIRAAAPDTPVLLFSYAVFGGSGGANAALTDISAFNAAVGGDPAAIWNKTAVGFHGYAGWKETSQAVALLNAAGYPCFMTEFGDEEWGTGQGGFGVMQTSELERLKVSWLAFCYIPPSGVSDNVAIPEIYKNRVDRAGLSWVPDYGTWPAQRSAYGNGGLPRATTETFVNNFLTGTLRIQAEDFDIGGQGVAWSDTDTANQGGQYRPAEGVDIQATTDTGGGYNVGWTQAGEWLEYSIFVPEPGFFNLSLRVASPNTGGAARVICYDLDKTGIWTIPNTGGTQSWTTITKQVFLEFGRQRLRLEVVTGGFNLNWIELSPSSAAPVANAAYKLVNQNSGMVMENNTSTHKVIQNPWSGANIQRWNLLHLGAGQYRIQSVQDNWYWNTWGETMTWWWGVDSQGQRFIVRSVGEEGYYCLMPVNSGRSYEVENASLAGGSAIVQKKYFGLANQKWAILPPSAPAFPTCLTARWVSASLVDLAWTASAGAISYNVKRSITAGGPYTTIANVTTTNYSDISVTAGVPYYYVVSANTANGETLNSNEASTAMLHAYLRFDEASGTTASDATGNGRNGTLVNGPTWGSGKFGNAVYLDGSNDHVTLPTGVVNGLTDFTISTWVYLNSASTWSRVFDFGTGTTNYMFLTPRHTNTSGTVRFAIRTPSVSERIINGTSALPTGAWTHVAVTLSGSTGILYVNGAEVGRNSSMTLTPNSLGATTQNYIGRSQYSDPYLNGRVDDFRIYAAALSAIEIARLYAEQVPTLPSAPTGLSATVISASQIDLTWTGSLDAVSYNIKRSTTSGGPYITIASSAGTSYSDTGLSESTTYYYVVSAVNGAGQSANSTQASATTLSSAPAAPTNLVAAAGDGSVTLNWDANTEGNLAGYNVYRSTLPESGYALLNSSLLSSPEFTDETVSNYTRYYYVVTAVDTNLMESPSSNPVSVMPRDVLAVVLSAADFEGGFGDWINVTGDDSHDWMRNTGGTLTPLTGPSGGANGSAWYVYLETSPGGANTAGNTAILQGPMLGGYNRVLTFYYHMYGAAIGTLNVDIFHDGTWQNDIWSRSGQQHTSNDQAYTQAIVNLAGYSGPIQLRFRAVALGGTMGDMAIDDIEVTGRVRYGDMNGDSIVNESDLSEFAGYWLYEDCGLDLNGDCRINLHEFAAFAENWMME